MGKLLLTDCLVNAKNIQTLALQADSDVACDRIRITRTTNCLIFMKKEYLLLV